MADQSAVALVDRPGHVARDLWRTRLDALPFSLTELSLLGIVVVLASWQVTLRSYDANGVALAGVNSVVNGTGGDLSQYRVLSPYLAIGLQTLLGGSVPPFQMVRFVQMLVIALLAYGYYGQLGLRPITRVLGICLIAGLISLSMGVSGPSSFSLDRFDDTIFYLVAALLVLGGRTGWIPPLMALAVANRETSVFIPTLVLARYGWRNRKALLTAATAWVVAAMVYFGIHSYYGPRPRVEDSYWGTAMVMRSLRMPGQVAFFFAAINLLPAVVLLTLRDVDPFLRRLFWYVVPLWFAIHIWAARLGEGIMYLAPITVVIVPLVLQGLERRLVGFPDGSASESPLRRPAG
ncbi:MAG: hypothetical protein JOZ87_24505 [Chloroflexi bacterium]|nr:hypothetical protein [Chloroflexota bacterium]